MLTSEIPVILSSAIVSECASCPYVWMGGGTPTTKLGISLDQFQQAMMPHFFIGDGISQPR